MITDRHAYLHTARYSADLGVLDAFVPWERIQERDFRRDPDDPVRFDRYQAEALAYRHVPAEALLGIACYTRDAKADFDRIAAERGLEMNVLAEPRWYF